MFQACRAREQQHRRCEQLLMTVVSFSVLNPHFFKKTEIAFGISTVLGCCEPQAFVAIRGRSESRFFAMCNFSRGTHSLLVLSCAMFVLFGTQCFSVRALMAVATSFHCMGLLANAPLLCGHKCPPGKGCSARDVPSSCPASTALVLTTWCGAALCSDRLSAGHAGDRSAACRMMLHAAQDPGVECNIRAPSSAAPRTLC